MQPTKRLRAAAEACWLPERRRALQTAALAAAAFSFAAHGFLFSNEFFSHDSVSYFAYSDWGFPFYTSLGRFLIPIYEFLKGNAAAPWLIGLLFLLWMTLTSWLVAQLLGIASKRGIVLTSGVLCTNLALTLTGASYIYCMDEYALALLLATAAACLFCRDGWPAAAGLVPLVLSLAIYQSYFTVAACLCMLEAMRRLSRGAAPLAVLRRGLRYLFLLALGFVLYYGLWTAACALAGVEKRRVGETLLPGGGLLSLLWSVNVRYFRFLLNLEGTLGWLLPAVHVLLILALVWRLFRLLADRTLPGRFLLLLLSCLLPTAFHSAFLLFPGGAHYLMAFAAELLYLLPILAMEPSARKRAGPWGRILLTALLCAALWQHIVFANQVYMKKDLEKNATLVLASQIIGRIEGVEGYVPGETPVAFAGRLDNNAYLDQARAPFQNLTVWMGLAHNQAATYNLGRYLTDYLHYPLLWDESRDYALLEEVQAMPVFPAAGSVDLVEGTVVVKLSGAQNAS